MRRQKVGGVSSGGWPSGASPKGKWEKEKGRGKGGREGGDLGACDGERSRTASHLGAGLGRVRTPAGCLGPEGAILTLCRNFRGVVCLIVYFKIFACLFPLPGRATSERGGSGCDVQAVRGPSGASRGIALPALRHPREPLGTELLQPPRRGAPELRSGSAGGETDGGLRGFPGLAMAEQTAPAKGSRGCRMLPSPGALSAGPRDVPQPLGCPRAAGAS